MKKLVIFCMILILAMTFNVFAGDGSEVPLRPVHTYSIIAYDSATGQFGAAVQSHYFKVADVIWAEPGVGAVATQSFVEFSYGPLGLEMMKDGKTSNEALKGLLASDPNENVRQVAMIDAHGNVAAHTGAKCIEAAGDHTGPNYSVQANLMENATVWDAMAKAFETTEGELSERMMAALEAAQAEGGDIRGKQSAAMLVVSGKPTGMPWVDRIVDLRVDDSPEPLKELRRLLNINKSYDYVDQGDVLFTKGDIEAANQAYAKAAELAPDNAEIIFWQAVSLVTVGKVDESLPLFKKVFAMNNNWRILVPRLVKSDLLPNDTAVINEIVSQ